MKNNTQKSELGKFLAGLSYESEKLEVKSKDFSDKDDILSLRQIEESLENLDNLLEGLKKGNKEKEIAKLG